MNHVCLSLLFLDFDFEKTFVKVSKGMLVTKLEAYDRDMK